MSTVSETSDAQLVDLLRQQGSLSIAQIADAMGVTPTAVRQRLSRLMVQGLVERSLADRGAARGRPGHLYSLTERARRQAGSNYGDLAMMLWEEIRSVKDPAVRRGLFERIAGAMARLYAGQVQGVGAVARMESVKRLFADRQVPMRVDGTPEQPVLTVLDCPYTELAERDRGICAVEKMLFAELLAAPVRLSQCRLEGHNCCQFETN